MEIAKMSQDTNAQMTLDKTMDNKQQDDDGQDG
jgi:hypothetical protein